jgi:hypothetical protein
MTQDPDKTAAEGALTIRKVMEQWPHQLAIIALEAKMVKARFDAYRREGFEVMHALSICLKKPEL